MCFLCKICNYETKTKTDYDRHLKSNKHVKKMEEDNNKNHLRCDFCNFAYASKSSLYNHRKICNKRPAIIKAAILEQNLEDVRQKIQEKEQHILEITENFYKQLLAIKDESINLFREENNRMRAENKQMHKDVEFYKNLATKASQVAGKFVIKSANALTYATENCAIRDD